MIQPLSNRVLIEPIIPSEYTKSGLYVPREITTFVADAWKKEAIMQGKVLAIGPGKDRIPMTARVGQIVTFSDTCSNRGRSPGVNDRRRTRDGSGFSTSSRRWTLIGMAFME